MTAALVALNRFGLGARAGEYRKVNHPRNWLRQQVQGNPPELASAPPTDEQVSRAHHGFLAGVLSANQNNIRRAARDNQQLFGREVNNLLTTRVTTDRPFAERWIAFWSNHLCISPGAEPRIVPLCGAYERQAIRPNVFGKYEDMLLASARHPAMMLYLDNFQSAGPNAATPARANNNQMRMRFGMQGNNQPRRMRRSGLNENYARELLELHTVGVDGGYTQQDIEQLALILTGWGMSGDNPNYEPVGFRYDDSFHEPGSKQLLGKTYYEAGEEEGIRAIRDLAKRTETARFLSKKIAMHFVADDPPRELVTALTRVWINTQGDLRQVALALVNHDQAWDPTYQKFRTPQDWLIAMYRALGTSTAPSDTVRTLEEMRHRVWAPPAPKGYDDTTLVWADSGALVTRMEYVQTHFADMRRTGSYPNPSDMLDVIDPDRTSPLGRMLSDRAIDNGDRLALLFASPNFQWR